MTRVTVEQQDRPPPRALTVAEFCRSHAISRATFYNLVKRGIGPQLMRIGSRKTLISAEAATAWRRQMEVAAEEAPASRTDRTKEDRARAREGGGNA